MKGTGGTFCELSFGKKVSRTSANPFWVVPTTTGEGSEKGGRVLRKGEGSTQFCGLTPFALLSVALLHVPFFFREPDRETDMMVQ